MPDKIKTTYAAKSEENILVHTGAMVDTSPLYSQISLDEGLGPPLSSVDPQQSKIEQLESEVRGLKAENDEFRDRLRILESSYGNVLIELAAIQRGMAQQDNLIRHLLSYICRSKNNGASPEPVLAPEPYPLASAMDPAPLPLPHLEPKSHPLPFSTLSNLQNLDQSLLSPLSSPYSNSGPTSNCHTECKSFPESIITSSCDTGLSERLCLGFTGASSHSTLLERRRDAEDESFTAGNLSALFTPV